MPGTQTLDRPTVVVLGGSIAGLAATERFREFADVTLYERQPYDNRRVNCGEAINDATLLPLPRTPENGFLNHIDGFDVELFTGTEHDGTDPLAVPHISVANGYVTDRDVVERRWADRLRRDAHVTIHEGENVTCDRYRSFVDTYDYVVDATGQPALSLKAAGRTGDYTGVLVALTADVEGDFAANLATPRIVFEGYVGYFWVFPKTPMRANVGIGWARDERPDDYVQALWAACDRNGVPRPTGTP